MSNIFLRYRRRMFRLTERTHVGKTMEDVRIYVCGVLGVAATLAVALPAS